MLSIFFVLVFLLSDIAQSFHVGLEQVTLAILLTLAVRPIGALIFGRAAEKIWPQADPDAEYRLLLGI